jgi:thymidylate synthase (FAD)
MITLLHSTPLAVCAHAIRQCWDSHSKSDNGGPKDLELIDKVGNKHKHSSTLEHLVYTFDVQDISRALLQELARHRIASLSVKSTRYTLKELREIPTLTHQPEEKHRIEQFCVFTGNSDVDNATTAALINLQHLIKEGVKNDIAKFALPDAYKTRLTWTINARSLQNFLSLRTAPGAMWEIRRMAYAVYVALPEEHKYLFNHCVYKETENVVAIYN